MPILKTCYTHARTQYRQSPTYHIYGSIIHLPTSSRMKVKTEKTLKAEEAAQNMQQKTRDYTRQQPAAVTCSGCTWPNQFAPLLLLCLWWSICLRMRTRLHLSWSFSRSCTVRSIIIMANVRVRAVRVNRNTVRNRASGVSDSRDLSYWGSYWPLYGSYWPLFVVSDFN